MTKRHRKPEAKTKPESAQQMPPQVNKIDSSKPTRENFQTEKASAVKIFSRCVTVVSVLLNFYLAYLALTPKVTIDYASHLISENPIALPLKISNIGLLPVYDIELFIEDKDIKSINNNTASGNKTHELLTNKLSPNKPSEYVYNKIAFMGDVPISGNVLVILKYKLPILGKVIISEPDIFSIYKSKDGFTRWIHR